MKASVETIIERLKTLPVDTLADVLSYVDFVAWRSCQSNGASRSAEAMAIHQRRGFANDRLPDEDNPHMWMTVMNPGDDIDTSAYDRLRRLGYAVPGLFHSKFRHFVHLRERAVPGIRDFRLRWLKPHKLVT
ncbi:MAG: hypothetical protein NT070_00065 [Cyanobacteria bacterium]|nr:hypothetical protein [Cyanobacteriota bacterium]